LHILVLGVIVQMWVGARVAVAKLGVQATNPEGAMIRRIKRYFAIRSYVRRLGPELVRRFGKRRFYTPEQVLQAVRGGGFGEADVCYAYSMFCNREDFDAHHAETGESCNYDAMRAEVGHSHLGGHADFETADVLHHAEHYADHGGHGDAAGYHDSGGHDGGGHH
jgi:hypothetical protein